MVIHRYIGAIAFVTAACSAPAPADSGENDAGADLGAGLVYVAQQGSDLVAVIDVATLTIKRQVRVGPDPLVSSGPHFIVLAPGDREYFVSLINAPQFAGICDAGQVQVSDGGCAVDPHAGHHGTLPGWIERRRVRDDALIARIDAGVSPAHIAISVDGNTAWVTNFDLRDKTQGTLSVIDLRTNEPIGTLQICAGPHGLVRTHDGTTLIAACVYGDAVALVDVATSTVTIVPVDPDAGAPGSPNFQPSFVAVAPGRDDFAYVTCATTNDVRVLDLHAKKFVATVRVGETPSNLASTNDGLTLLVANEALDTVSMIDTASRIEKRQISILPHTDPEGIAVSPDDSLAFVSCEGDHLTPSSLAVIDLQAGVRKQFVDLGIWPIGVAIAPHRE